MNARYTARSIAQALLFGLLLSLVGSLAVADTSRDFGDYVIRCKVMPSMDLDPAIAERLSVPRDPNTGILNIAVMEKTGDDAMGRAAQSDISAHWRDLDGMMGTIAFREIRDRDSIFYIGQFDLPGSVMITFDVLVQVDDSRPPYSLSFNKAISE